MFDYGLTTILRDILIFMFTNALRNRYFPQEIVLHNYLPTAHGSLYSSFALNINLRHTDISQLTTKTKINIFCEFLRSTLMAYYISPKKCETPEIDVAYHVKRVDDLDNYFKNFSLDPPELDPVVRLKKIYETKYCSDVTLILMKDRSSFQAHKFVLSFSSRVLANLLEKDPSIDQYELDYDPQAFQWFLEHSYNVNTNFPTEHLAIRKIYGLLKELEMFEVLKNLREFIGTILTPEDVDSFYQLAIDCKDVELQSKCYEYVGENCQHIVQVAAEGKLSSRVLKLAVSQEHLNFLEIEIFNNVIQWAKKQLEKAELSKTGQNVRATIRPILPEIDFLNIDVPDIMMKVYGENIFTDSEIQAILQLGMEVNTKPMPEVGTFPDYPKDLNPKPRTRNFIRAVDAMRVVTLTSEVCKYKTVWRNVNAMELVLFQVNKSILVFEVKAKPSCHFGNCHLEFHCNGNLLGKSASGATKWKFENPIHVAKDETYSVLMMGSGKTSSHEVKMFTVTSNGVVFSGKSLCCSVSISFRLKVNHQ